MTVRSCEGRGPSASAPSLPPRPSRKAEGCAARGRVVGGRPTADHPPFWEGTVVGLPMAEGKPARKGTKRSGQGFTEDERAAMRQRSRELKAQARGGKKDGEADVLAAIAAMQGSDRILAEQLHALVKANAPSLTPRTWYGFPAYAKDGQVVCFFQFAGKFKTRYATLGFSDEAKLDEGRMWPVVYALTDLTPAEEARIAALVKKAVG